MGIVKKGGSCEAAAAAAARALLDAGCSPLEVKIGAHVASYGGATCWQTDVAMGTLVRHADGRAYHVESIGRARRRLAARGWLQSRRVFAGQRLQGARWPSSHGTTDKRLLWSKLGLRNPVTKREQREIRARQRANQRAYEALSVGAVLGSARDANQERAPRTAPRHSAAAPASAPTPLDGELAAIAARVEAMIDRRVDREDGAHDAAQVAAALGRLSDATHPRGPP